MAANMYGRVQPGTARAVVGLDAEGVVGGTLRPAAPSAHSPVEDVGPLAMPRSPLTADSSDSYSDSAAVAAVPAVPMDSVTVEADLVQLIRPNQRPGTKKETVSMTNPRRPR